MYDDADVQVAPEGLNGGAHVSPVLAPISSMLWKTESVERSVPPRSTDSRMSSHPSRAHRYSSLLIGS
eukprot:8194721-Pyramimonas_sp.AAC.1